MILTTLGNDDFKDNMAFLGKSFAEIGTIFKSSFEDAFSDVNAKSDNAITNIKKIKAGLSGIDHGLKGIFTSTKNSPFELLSEEKASQQMVQFAKATDKGAEALQEFNLKLQDKGLKAYFGTVDAGKASFEGYKEYINHTNAALQKTTIASQAAAFGMKALSSAGNMLLGLGIGVVIQAVAQGIDDLVHADERAIEKANELVDAYNKVNTEITDNLSFLNSTSSEFKDLSKGVDDYGNNISLSADEYTRYKEIVQQILDISPSLITGYDAEGQAIANKNGLLETSIQLEKEKLALQREDITSPEKLWDTQKGYNAEFQKLEEQLKKHKESLQSIIRDMTDGGFWGESAEQLQKKDFIADLLGIDKSSNTYQQALWSNDSGWGRDIIENIDEIYREASLHTEIFTKEDLEKFKEYIDKREQLAQQLNSQSQKINPILQEVPQTLSVYDKLSSAQKDFVATYINGFRIKPEDVDNEDAMRVIRQNILDFTQSIADNPTIQNSINKLFALDKEALSYGEWQDTANEIINNIADALGLEGDEREDFIIKIGFKTNELDDTIAEIDKEMSKVSATELRENFTDQQIRILYKIENKGDLTIDELKAKVENFEKTNHPSISLDFSDLLNNLSALKESYDLLSDAQKELDDNGLLTLKTINSLSEKYTELQGPLLDYITGIKTEAEMQDILRQAQQKTTEDYLLQIRSRVLSQNEAVVAFANAYGVDLQNFTEAEYQKLLAAVDAKAQEAGINNENVGVLASQYNVDLSNFKTVQEKKIAILNAIKREQIFSLQNQLASGVYSGEEIYELKKQIGQLSSQLIDPSIVYKFKAVLDFSAPKQLTYNPSKVSSNSKKAASSSTDTWKEAFDKEYAELQHKLKMEQITQQEYYNALSALDQKYFAGRSKYVEEHRKNLEELFDLQREIDKDWLNDQEHQIYLLEQKGGNEDQVIDIYKKLISKTESMISQAKKMGLDGNSDYVQELEKQWWEYKNKIDEIQKSIYESQLEGLEKQKSNYETAYNTVISLIDNEVNKLNDANDAKIKAYDKEIEKLNEKKEALEDQLSIYETVASTVQERLDEETNALNQKRDEEEKYWNDKIDALQAQNDEIDEQIKLEQAQEDLARARSQKTSLVYRKGQGFVYESNQEDVNDAQNALDELERELKLKNAIKELEASRDEALKLIDEQLDALEDYKEAWQDAVDSYVNQQNKLLAEQILGKNWEKDILDGRVDIVTKFKDALFDINKQLDENVQGSVSNQIAALEDSKEKENQYTQEKIDKLEEYKEVWTDAFESYQKAQDDNIAKMILGNNYEKDILNKRLEIVKDFKTKYNKILSEIDSLNNKINPPSTSEGTSGGNSNGSSGGSSGSSSPGSSNGNSGSAINTSNIGRKAAVTNSNATSYYDSYGRYPANWSIRAKNAGIGWNSQLYITNLNNNKVALGKSKDIKSTIAWIDLKNVKGYAKGTTSASGGIVKLGEEGMELGVIGQGNGVIPADATAKLLEWSKINPTPIVDAIDKLSKIAYQSFGKVSLKQSNMASITIGDIIVKEQIQNVEGLSDAIVRQLPNQLIQDIFKQR